MKNLRFYFLTILMFNSAYGQLEIYHKDYTYLAHPSTIRFVGKNTINSTFTSAFTSARFVSNLGYFHQTINNKWRIGANTQIHNFTPTFRFANIQGIINRNIYESETRTLTIGYAVSTPINISKQVYYYRYIQSNLGLSYSGKILELTATYKITNSIYTDLNQHKVYNTYQNLIGFVGLKCPIREATLSTRIGFYNKYSLYYGQQLKLKRGINFGYGFGVGHLQANMGYQTNRWNFNVSYGRMGSYLYNNEITAGIQFKF